jgi:hypothetical protein
LEAEGEVEWEGGGCFEGVGGGWVVEVAVEEWEEVLIGLGCLLAVFLFGFFCLFVSLSCICALFFFLFFWASQRSRLLALGCFGYFFCCEKRYLCFYGNRKALVPGGGMDGGFQITRFFFCYFCLRSLPLHNRNISISNPFLLPLEHDCLPPIASFLQEHFRAF